MFQWLQNHSCKGRNSNRQSPFVVRYKAAFLHWLNAQRQTAFAKSNRVFMLSVSVSGRFDEAVIEERRKATEAMLLFTTTIPALYNSPQLKEFFRVRNTHIHTEGETDMKEPRTCARRKKYARPRDVLFSLCLLLPHNTSFHPTSVHLPRLPLFLPPSSQGGEVTRPLDPTSLSSAGPLPPPLIPLPKRRTSDCEPAEEEEGREAPTLPQDLGTNVGLEVGEPEVAAEAYSEMGGSPREEEQEELSDTELDDRGMMRKRNLPEVALSSFISLILLVLSSGSCFHL